MSSFEFKISYLVQMQALLKSVNIELRQYTTYSLTFLKIF